jgi:hypothetical protein
VLGGYIPGQPIDVACSKCGAPLEWASLWASGEPNGVDEEAPDRPI